MEFSPCRIVITGAGRGLGRALAIRFAKINGAEIFLSSRDGKKAEEVCKKLQMLGQQNLRAFSCDLTKAESVRAFSSQIAQITSHVDILINNGAAWLEGALETATDEEITDTISSGATGAILMVKHFLPLLRKSSRPDIVNIISSAALPNTDDCAGHLAFYAAKGGQGRMAEVLSQRLRPEGIRVISLYPPNFDDFNPWEKPTEKDPRVNNRLNGQSIVDCVLFAINQPRNCFIRKFEFEPG